MTVAQDHFARIVTEFCDLRTPQTELNPAWSQQRSNYLFMLHIHSRLCGQFKDIDCNLHRCLISSTSSDAHLAGKYSEIFASRKHVWTIAVFFTCFPDCLQDARKISSQYLVARPICHQRKYK